MAATSEIRVTGLENLERASQARAEERRREIALECASRVMSGDVTSYNYPAWVTLDMARDFEKYLRGEQ